MQLHNYDMVRGLKASQKLKIHSKRNGWTLPQNLAKPTEMKLLRKPKLPVFFGRPPPGWSVVDHMEKTHSHSPLKGSKWVNFAEVKSQIQVGALRFTPEN